MSIEDVVREHFDMKSIKKLMRFLNHVYFFLVIAVG